MRIGPRHWRWVSTDTAGVPHGGPYGDVDRFVREAERHGLLVGWSLIWKCFGIYTQRGPARTVCQMLLKNADGPIPFSDNLLWLLLNAWEQHSRTGSETIIEHIAQLVRDRKRAAAAARYEQMSVIVQDSTREAFIIRGKRDRPLISIPQLDISQRAKVDNGDIIRQMDNDNAGSAASRRSKLRSRRSRRRCS